MKGKPLLALIAVAEGWTQDPRELVRRSIAQDQLDWVRMKDYTWQAHSVERHFDSNGKVKSTESKTYEIMVLAGEHAEKLIAKDDKPLPEKEAKNEDEKIQKLIAKGEKESESDRKNQACLPHQRG